MGFDFDLITSDDGTTVIAKSVENLYILREKEKDAAVFGEITKIATENGIDTYLTLNEKAIIKAFEKQIPKKPEYYGDGYSDGKLVYDYAKCPVCGRDDFEYDINNWGCSYCPDCGQALDWSDTE